MISPEVLDLIVVVALVITVVRGFSHGSIREFFSLAGIIGAVLVAPILVGPLAGLVREAMDTEINVARVVALGIILALGSIVGAIIGIRTASGVELPGPRSLNGTGGAIFGLIRTVTVLALLFYGVLAISASSNTDGRITTSIDESVSGQLLADLDSPFTIFFDSMLSRSDDLRALTLWVRQRSGFRESVPEDRLDFDATDEPLDAVPDGERRMLQLLNNERAERGLDPLTMCVSCAKLARGHSHDMYRNGYFSHVDSDGMNPFERMQAANIRYEAAGENLSIAPSIAEAHRGLMASPDHRANIMRSTFDQVGIGCLDGPYGLVCTQVFRTII
jgi:uncharacterized membrane protein required for colicin V production